MPSCNKPVPLVCDLDNTLLSTDTLYEAIINLIRSRPGLIFQMPIRSGKLAVKEFLAPFYPASNLPINLRVKNYLLNSGQPLYLATASPEGPVRAIQADKPVFQEVFSSHDGINLAGQNKADLLIKKFGLKGFDYIGDSLTDVPVWKAARKAIVCSGNSSVINACRKANENCRVIQVPKATIGDYARLFRIRQWTKNLLVFTALILGHNFSFPKILLCLLGFFSLSFCASAIYIINDLFDLASDRAHPRKANRPLASGIVHIKHVPLLFSFCIFFSFLLTLWLPLNFFYCLCLYLILTIIYTIFLKKHLFIDVIILALLYMLRIIAGAMTIGINPSNWLLGFAGFFFLGLALLKRTGGATMDKNNSGLIGRAYLNNDLPVIETMAIASGFSSFVIIALYIDTLQALTLYAHSGILWAICPILVFWYGRLCILCHRGIISDDPVNFAITDKISLLCLFLCGIIFFLAI